MQNIGYLKDSTDYTIACELRGEKRKVSDHGDFILEFEFEATVDLQKRNIKFLLNS